MNSIEIQLAQVSEKVDALHTKLEVLNNRIEDMSIFQQQTSNPMTASGASYQALNHDLSNHKDVLSDEKQRSHGQADLNAGLSSDVQIQRLTAQLTAAYGRIAALEEQLLARR